MSLSADMQSTKQFTRNTSVNSRDIMRKYVNSKVVELLMMH